MDGISIKDAIRLFAEDNGMEIHGKLTTWLLDLYTSNSNDFIIRKQDDRFYSSKEWRNLRKRVIEFYGNNCLKCGSYCEEVHVDHIKPRSKFKELELCFDNLQPLCWLCNLTKSNKDITDYRTSYRVNGETTISDMILLAKKGQQDMSHHEVKK